MSKLPILLLVLIFSCWAVAQNEQAAPAIPEQTPVEIELLETISSDSMHDGQKIGFKIVTPVEVGGATVMAAGMPLSGEVKKVKSSGAWQKAGSFDLSLDAIRLSEGTVVQLDFKRPKRVGTKGQKTAVAIAAVPVMMYYFPLVPIAVVGSARHGKPYVIRAGERYLVYVTSCERPAHGAAAADGAETPKEPRKP